MKFFFYIFNYGLGFVALLRLAIKLLVRNLT